MHRRPSLVVVSLFMLLVPSVASAQYFGRNKVTYDDFDFRVLRTQHFDLYHYDAEHERPIRDFARMAERWYERLARTFQHEFQERKPLIVYRNSPDFQQTNTIEGLIPQSTGGVTESLKNRVILPFAGSYGETDHVLGHELVHAFQYDLAQGRTGDGATAIGQVPLWLVEGMAEYLSLGRRDPHTAMWMRDAVWRDDVPSIEDLSNPQEYFPYRYGQAFWAYVAGRWGDDVASDFYRMVARRGPQGAVSLVLGVEPDTLSSEWRRDLERYYGPLMEGRTPPTELGRRLLGTDDSELNLAPEVSPDGAWIMVLSQQDPFSLGLFLVEAETGDVVAELASSERNAHFDALAFTNTSGTWSPDGTRFAFVTYEEGDNEIAIADVDERRVTRTISVSDVGAITGLAWSPDGREIAFAGSRGGVHDLFLLDLETENARSLTDDRFTERHPSWSPDGRFLAFSTDRGQAADLDLLTLPEPALAVMDVSSGDIDVIRPFDGKHIDPTFGPDGRSLLFVSDREGFSDVYRYELDTGRTFQVTRLTTGVSGLTRYAPALSVARETGDAVLTAFHDGAYIVTALAGEELGGSPVGAAPSAPAAFLPPPEVAGDLDLVSRYLGDPRTGLPASEADWVVDVSDYEPGLQLDYIAQPSAGIAVDRFGTALGGSVAAYFSDMLGDHQLGVALSANGSVQDIGGQAVYVDRGSRLNWGLQAGRIPYRNAFATVGDQDLDGTSVRAVDVVISRTIIYRGSLMLEYPLSLTRRLEFSAGGTHMSFDREIQRDFISNAGRVIDRREIDVPAPSSLNLGSATAAFVQDNAQFGFTSPVSGQRARLEVDANLGTLEFVNALADLRSYGFMDPLTLGVRLLHYGRYGQDAESDRLSPLFLGQGSFVRGYSYGSFTGSECTAVPDDPGACPEFDRLIGSRIALANVELRIPLIGTEQFGLLDWGFLPTELSLFADAGVAWTSEESPTLELTRRSTERIPVASAGTSLRFNVLGRLVMEVFYAVPFQRPGESHVWGFQISPGW